MDFQKNPTKKNRDLADPWQVMAAAIFSSLTFLGLGLAGAPWDGSMPEEETMGKVGENDGFMGKPMGQFWKHSDFMVI